MVGAICLQDLLFLILILILGELYKQGMLTVNIMVRCLGSLLDHTDEERLECLCKLLTTIGKELESKNVDLSSIFRTMQEIVDKKHGKISSRVRYEYFSRLCFGDFFIYHICL